MHCNNKTLVIGGMGFIGKSLVQLLEQKGEEVIITSQYHTPKNKSNVYNINYDFDSFKQILDRYKFKDVYFLSGNPYPQHSENNFILDFRLSNIPLFSLLEAMRILKYKGNFWFASSVAVYGSTNKDIQSETDTCFPLSNYGVSKLNAEEYIKYFSRVHHINCGALRIFSTYGGGLKRQLIYDVYRKIKLNDEEITLLGTGKESRDLSYVDDQAEKIVLIAQNIIPNGDIYNIGSGNLYTVNEVVTHIKNILKSKVNIKYNTNTRKFDGIRWVADINKLQELGVCKDISLFDGLSKTIVDFDKDNKSDIYE